MKQTKYFDENIEIKNNGVFGICAKLINDNCYFTHSYDEWLTYDDKNIPPYTDENEWKLLLPHLSKVRNMALDMYRYYESIKISEFYRKEDSYYVQVMIEVNKKRLYRNIEISFNEFNNEYFQPKKYSTKLNITPYQVFNYMIEYALKKLDKNLQEDFDYLSSLITISAEPDNLTVTLGLYSISMTYQDWVCVNDAYFQQQTEHLFDPYLSKIKSLAHTILNTITNANDEIKETEMFFDKEGKLVVRPLDRMKKMEEAKKKLKEKMEKSVTLDIQKVDGETKITKIPEEELTTKQYEEKERMIRGENIDKSKEWSNFTAEREISAKLEELNSD